MSCYELSLALGADLRHVWEIIWLFAAALNTNTPLDREAVAGAIERGLDDLSDADRRSLGMAADRLDGLTVEDAELARRIADTLRNTAATA